MCVAIRWAEKNNLKQHWLSCFVGGSSVVVN